VTSPRGYLIDTNVISELVREAPSIAVMRWLINQSVDSLYVSVISLAELVYGVMRLPPGARREQLERWLEVDIRDQFPGRLLEFGESQAIAWGRLKSSVEKQGCPREAIDLQLAATAKVAQLAIATRNVQDFAGLGLTVIDPWAS
jgi:predicted nucleic acid-binding protein